MSNVIKVAIDIDFLEALTLTIDIVDDFQIIDIDPKISTLLMS